MSFYYVTDDNVSRDLELQAWVQDLHDNGFPVRDGDIDHGFPSSLNSLGELVEMLTRILFTCSCQHAAVNFPQMPMYSFIPNYPNIMCQQPPTEKGVVNLKFIMETLPTKRMTGWQIATVYTLTQFADDEVGPKYYVISFIAKSICRKDITYIISLLRLFQLSKKIKKTNILHQ